MFFSLVLCAFIVASSQSSISPRELYPPEVAPPWMWIPHTWSLLGTIELPVWFTLKNNTKIYLYLLSSHPPIEVWMLKLALWYSASVKSRREVSVWEWLRCQENGGNYWNPEKEAMRAVVVSDPHAGLSCCWKEQITSKWHTKWTDHWHSLRGLVDHYCLSASLSNCWRSVLNGLVLATRALGTIVWNSTRRQSRTRVRGFRSVALCW